MTKNSIPKNNNIAPIINFKGPNRYHPEGLSIINNNPKANKVKLPNRIAAIDIILGKTWTNIIQITPKAREINKEYLIIS